MTPQILPHFVRFHRRLLIAVCIGALVGFASPTVPGISGVLLGWNAGAWTYLVLLALMMAFAPRERVRELAEREDESAVTVLSVISLSAIASLLAIVRVLATARAAGPHLGAVHLVLAAATLLAGWLLVPMIYTLHYTRLYFSDRESPRALRFPDADVEPDYWDFLYFSFTIAVASQTSDISLASRRMRRAALAQSVLSFFFNLAILGLSINIGASLLS